MTTHTRIIPAALLAVLVAAAIPVLAQAPTQRDSVAPTDAQVRELAQQIDSLQREVDALRATSDPTTRQRLTRQNWRGVQDYMAQLHDRWGMGYAWMDGRGMMGCPMFARDEAWWPVPSGMTPEQYRQQMRVQLQRMQTQMEKISQTTDPRERRRLLQEHWQGTYQEMQTMRGMGWMWDGGSMMGPGMMRGGMMGRGPSASAKPLPDATSAGAALVSTYCTQCHAAPQPTLHTAKEWAGTTQRMRGHMASGLPGIKTPSEQDMDTILAYMQGHARQ